MIYICISICFGIFICILEFFENWIQFACWSSIWPCGGGLCPLLWWKGNYRLIIHTNQSSGQGCHLFGQKQKTTFLSKKYMSKFRQIHFAIWWNISEIWTNSLLIIIMWFIFHTNQSSSQRFHLIGQKQKTTLLWKVHSFRHFEYLASQKSQDFLFFAYTGDFVTPKTSCDF